MEKLLHYIWKYKLFPLKPLQTTDGLTLEVIDPGTLNRDAGPDFFNAKIKLDGTTWVGNIEIHGRLPIGTPTGITKTPTTTTSSCM